ncbi:MULTISPECIES: hypothetical protein [Halobacterium]|uniref:Uncharacterized protein n=4 Tax=Halobacterium salinarum TaxID=2242 RepID=Q9HNH2_HALSA|nr:MULTISPECIES: hypothetical protein [Halobacterium]AAG20248.1 hypothetical protein VNG_2105H [Halobacterium salinarum NRC-1]MBB6089265.1 apolipoprotein N-acyltransferase [Halobacterium salinarum]MCF2165869.1 hypothetical protein [Halobacterium salinarum]MCF2167362.1 hypothetical protein [Halobacterium salinarum]MCF2207359.1 hypothetical protein [Halobacterium salinarum]
MPERPGVQNLLDALNVATQVKRGAVVGALVAIGTYWLFVVSAGGSAYPTPYLAGMGLVLAFTVAMFATAVFTLGAAYRVSKTVDIPDSD